MNVTPTMVAVITHVPTHWDHSYAAVEQDIYLLQMAKVALVILNFLHNRLGTLIIVQILGSLL